MSENNADGTVENNQPTVEELQAKLSKAEAKIVDLKKTPTDESTTDVNKEEEEKPKSFGKEEVESMIKAALQEKAVNNQEEQYRNNQNETNSASVTSEEPVVNTGFNAMSVDEYSKLPHKAQLEYLKDSVAKTGETQFA